MDKKIIKGRVSEDQKTQLKSGFIKKINQLLLC